jgi:integrase
MATLILVAFRHGLRAVEIADLEWSQVEWGRNPALHVRRAKSGKSAVHPIRGNELRMLASCNAIRRVLSSLRLSAAARLPLTPSTAS